MPLTIRPWDASVKALDPFPDVLSMMSEKLEWTQMVGDAFLAQEDDVMDTVQRLRQKAYAAGQSEKFGEATGAPWKMIPSGSSQPTRRSFMSPPMTPRGYMARGGGRPYPPYVIYPYWPGVVITPGFIVFGVGCFVGAFWGHVWGHWDWRQHRVFVNQNRNININHRNIDASNIRTTPWMHHPAHRRGVPYRGPSARDRFRQVNPGAVENRRPFRGFDRSPGKVPGGSGRTFEQNGWALPAGARGTFDGRAGNRGAVSVPGAATARTAAPRVVSPPSLPRGTVNRIPGPPVSRPGGGGGRNMDAFRGIGQGSEVRRQSSWGASIRSGVPSGQQVTGGIPGAGGGTRSGSGGRSPQGGRR